MSNAEVEMNLHGMDISGLDVHVVTDDDVNHVVSGNFSHNFFHAY